MKYTDHDRVERIFSKGTELLQYIRESGVTRDALLTTTPKK